MSVVRFCLSRRGESFGSLICVEHLLVVSSMGDRSLPEVNRLCDARYRSYVADLHGKQKQEIKTTINNQSPQTFAHLTSRRKRKQTQLGRMHTLVVMMWLLSALM